MVSTYITSDDVSYRLFNGASVPDTSTIDTDYYDYLDNRSFMITCQVIDIVSTSAPADVNDLLKGIQLIIFDNLLANKFTDVMALREQFKRPLMQAGYTNVSNYGSGIKTAHNYDKVWRYGGGGNKWW